MTQSIVVMCAPFPEIETKLSAEEVREYANRVAAQSNRLIEISEASIDREKILRDQVASLHKQLSDREGECVKLRRVIDVEEAINQFKSRVTDLHNQHVAKMGSCGRARHDVREARRSHRNHDEGSRGNGRSATFQTQAAKTEGEVMKTKSPEFLFVALMAVLLGLLLGTVARLCYGQTMPLAAGSNYKVQVLTFEQANCQYCAAAAVEWDKLKISRVHRWNLQEYPQAFAIKKITGTPTTVVVVKRIDEVSLLGREFVRFDGVAKAADIQAAMKRAQLLIDAGVPETGDIRELPEKAP